MRSSANPYTYKQAFKNSPTSGDLLLLHSILNRAWGKAPSTCDPCAGGGSIPFCSSRFGLQTRANDLNPVAAAILLAGLQLPAEYGRGLADDLARFGRDLVSSCTDRLDGFFPQAADEVITNYIFARTITCPRTGKLVPLSPNWWLSKGAKPVAVRLVAERGGRQLERCEFEIVAGKAIDFDPDRGTVAGGDAISPWDGLAIDGDHIKAEAQAGRMGDQLYAVAIRTAEATRLPGADADRSRCARRRGAGADQEAAALAGRGHCAGMSRSTRCRTMTAATDSTGSIPGAGCSRPVSSLFTVRSLRSSVASCLWCVRSCHEGRADAVLTLLALMQGKALNYNSMIVRSGTRPVTRWQTCSTRHNFSFKWTLWRVRGCSRADPWCLDQIMDAYDEIARASPALRRGVICIDASRSMCREGDGSRSQRQLTSSRLTTGSVELVCIDPPYYDNVMYAELSDFFYVWEKRTLGLDLARTIRGTDLTDKQSEAVANHGALRWMRASAGRNSPTLTTRRRWRRSSRECQPDSPRRRRHDGDVHAQARRGMGHAGHGAYAGGLHDRDFLAGEHGDRAEPPPGARRTRPPRRSCSCAASGIASDGEPPIFEDLEGDVSVGRARRARAVPRGGIAGVDLLLATYGPALSVISSHGPSTRRRPTRTQGARVSSVRRRRWTRRARRLYGCSASGSSADRSHSTRIPISR